MTDRQNAARLIMNERLTVAEENRAISAIASHTSPLTTRESRRSGDIQTSQNLERRHTIG